MLQKIMDTWFVAYDVRSTVYYVAYNVRGDRVGNTPSMPHREAMVAWLNDMRESV